MITLVSPAKKLDFSNTDILSQFSQCDFLKKSQILIDETKNMSISELKTLMKISDKLAEINRERFKQWSIPFTKENAKNTTLFCGAWFLIWCFLIMLSLMGNGFKLLGMKDSSKMFDIVDNPISALMIGILVTVLLVLLVVLNNLLLYSLFLPISVFPIYIYFRI